MIIKKITVLLALSSTLLSVSSSFASQDLMTLRSGYDLKPGVSEEFKSNTFSDRDLRCVIRKSSEDLESATTLNITATKNDAVINNIVIKEGTSFSLPVHVGQKMNVTIDKRGRIILKNEGNHTINLKC